MEIIKNGKTSKTISCPQCDCIFRYSKVDISYSGYEKEVRCPECSKCIQV